MRPTEASVALLAQVLADAAIHVIRSKMSRLSKCGSGFAAQDPPVLCETVGQEQRPQLLLDPQALARVLCAR